MHVRMMCSRRNRLLPLSLYKFILNGLREIFMSEESVVVEARTAEPEKVKAKRDPLKLKRYRDKYAAKKRAAAQQEPDTRKRAVRVNKKAKPDAQKRGPKGWSEEDKRREGSKRWGLLLRKKRLELGYTQAEFAEFFDIKQPHMCNLEKGTFRPGKYLKELIEKKFFKKVGVGKPRKGAPKA